MMRRWFVAAVLLACVAGCGEGSPSSTGPAPSSSITAELAATGVGDYLGIQSASMAPKNGWEEYFYDPRTEQAICLDGSKFQVNLRRGTSQHVMLYLEGGGACWNYSTCWDLTLAKLTADSAEGAGILDFSNPTNPFNDWNIIYVPYCDGAVFTGNNIVDYQNETQTKTKHTYHHGIQNLSAAVTLMQREFPHPDQLLVAGSSAGGYGTYTGYAVTRVAFPDSPIIVFDDSGPGLQNPADTEGIADRNANWKYLEYIPPSCTKCAIQESYLTDWAMDRDPTLRTALYSYLQDGVIRTFLNLDGPSYEALLRPITDDLHALHPDRFKRFLKTGRGHTVLELPNFYTLTVGGETARDWTADFLSNDPGWQERIDSTP